MYKNSYSIGIIVFRVFDKKKIFGVSRITFDFFTVVYVIMPYIALAINVSFIINTIITK